ncbi:hypothetical protein [uncultured Aurantimicrobium sp.]|uniref:hypothetical protein n=1 Tax=uncultured Aurantimicrobium sp. TaxID=1705357 RepID=UPI002605D647|nr:hypothetical protein [uncultured Aurantimicrobium sp.]
MNEKLKRSVGAWIIAAVFALLFAYDVWEGIGNFIGVMSQSLSLGIGLSAFGWFAVILGIIAPVVLFFGALWLTRKLSLAPSVVIYVVALTVSAVIGVDLALGTNAFLIFSVN